MCVFKIIQRSLANGLYIGVLYVCIMYEYVRFVHVLFGHHKLYLFI